MNTKLNLIALEERIVLDAALAATIVPSAHDVVHAPSNHVIYVDANNSHSGQTGNDWAHAYADLQAALNKVTAGSAWDIKIANGTYNTTAGFTVAANASVQLEGGFRGYYASTATSTVIAGISSTFVTTPQLATPGDSTEQLIGEIMPNLVWSGLVDTTNGGNNQVDPFQSISLSQFSTLSDPSSKYIYITECAGWCPPCRDEATFMESLVQTYEPLGIKFISALAETDTHDQPADAAFIRSWAAQYGLTNTLVNDGPSILTGPYGQFNSQMAIPFQMIIDASNMRIVDVFYGSGSDPSFLNAKFSDLVANGHQFNDTVVGLQQSLLTLNNDNVAISGITFRDGKNLSGNGGAIAQTGGTLLIENSSFVANTASDFGGAIFSQNGSLYVEDTTFTDNGQQLYFNVPAGGAIYAAQDSAMVFSNIGVSGSSDALNLSGNFAIIKDSSLGHGHGCGFFHRHHHDGNIFSNNDGVVSFTGGSLTLDNDTFSDNNISNVIEANVTANFTVKDSTFSNNNAVALSVTGAGNVSITNSDFSNNLEAGGIFGNFNVTVKDSSFTSSRLIFANSTPGTTSATIVNSSFAGANSGAFFPDTGALLVANFATLNLKNDSFVNNVGNSGGALHVENVGSTVIDNSTFANNFASLFGQAAGGAVYLFSDGDVSIKNSKFTNNSADFIGGAVYANSLSGTLSVANSTFTGNTAVLEGGAIEAGALGGLAISNSTFTNNTAQTGAGGAITVFSTGSISINNTTFKGNAGAIGGALFAIADGSVSLSNSTFTSNVSTGSSGGAVYTQQNSSLTVTNSTFNGNSSANNGGAIVDALNGSATINNNTFKNNTAVNTGGAIASVQTATLTVTKNTFNGNSAAVGGSVRALADNSVTITGNSFGTDYASLQGAELDLEGNASINGIANIPANASSILNNLKAKNSSLLTNEIYLA